MEKEMKRQECKIMTIKTNKNEENLQIGTSRRKSNGFKRKEMNRRKKKFEIRTNFIVLKFDFKICSVTLLDKVCITLSMDRFDSEDNIQVSLNSLFHFMCINFLLLKSLI